MAIFRRDQPSSEPERPAPPAEVRATPVRAKRTEEKPRSPQKSTLVARGTRFEGILRGDAEVLVEGEIVGEIDLDGDIEIGSHGRVQGNIKVHSARVSGQVKGNTIGRDVIEVTPSGRLEGDVTAPRVIIREGAFFRGNIEMTGQKSQTGSAKAKTSPGAPPASGGGAAKGSGAPASARDGVQPKKP